MTFIDICAGIGGFRSGLEKAGMECIGYVEIDNFARKSYEAMYDTDGEWTAEDVSKLRADDVPKSDLWCFGFPCQDISVAGNQRGLKGERSGIFYSIIGLIKGKKPEDRPEWLLIENVKNLLSVNGGRDFTEVLNEISEAGYDCEWSVFNSKDFGVPQNRERVYIVGHLRDRGRRQILFESGTGRETSTESGINRLLRGKHQSDKVLGVDGVSQTLLAGQGGGIGGGMRTGLYAVPKIQTMVKGAHETEDIISEEGVSKTLKSTDYKNPHKVAIPKIKTIATGEHQRQRVQEFSGLARCLTATDYKEPQPVAVPKLRQIVKGSQADRVYDSQGLSKTLASQAGGGGAKTGYYTVPCLTPDRVNKKQNGRRFKNNEDPMFTLTAQDRHGIMTYDGKEYNIRRLTPRECFRLQGFTDEQFEKAQAVNSNTQLYKQAGNAVTVNVAEAIARRIVEDELLDT